MQVAKIVLVLVLAVAAFVLAGCMGNQVLASDARAVNPEDYGSLDLAHNHDGYHLEEFMTACGATTVFQEDGANIVAECDGWRIQIQTYEVESGLADPFWCTQVFLYKNEGPRYAFGHIDGAIPRTVAQPERVLVRDESAKPWRQRLEKATLEDLIELMTSGNLLEDKSNPLEGLSFTYLETDKEGNNWEHQPNSEPKPVNVSALPPSELSPDNK